MTLRLSVRPHSSTLRVTAITLIATLLIQIATPLAQGTQRPRPPEPQNPVVSALRAMELSTTGPIAAASSAAITPDLYTGSVTTSVAIPLPAGRARMAPTLALNYRPTDPDEFAGLGWSLEQGVIVRDTADGIDYAGNEYLFKFAGGAYKLVGPIGGFYWAEIENAFTRFQRISAAGSVHWVGTDRLGKTFVFGQTPESRAFRPASPGEVAAWHIERIVDLEQNEIRFRYERDQNVVYPVEITYTHHPRAASENAVQFAYEDRPAADTVARYDLRMEQVKRRRLALIIVRANGTIYSVHKLAYQASPYTHRSLLRQILTYGNAASVSGTSVSGTTLPPKTFDYTRSGELSQALDFTTDPSASAGRQWTDFDGDGLSDYCRVTGSWPERTAQIACRLGASGFRNEFRTHIKDFDPGYDDGRLWIDVNDDGRSDFCRIVGEARRWIARCTFWNANGVAKDIDSPAMPEPEQVHRAWVDLDGDRLVDFCRAIRKPLPSPFPQFPLPPISQPAQLNQDLGDGDLKCLRFTGAAYVTGPATAAPVRLGLRSGTAWIDFNGDRLIDYCRLVDLAPWCQLQSSGAFGSTVALPRFDIGYPTGRAWVDANADRLPDYCRVVGMPDNQVLRCGINDGTRLVRELDFRLGLGRRLVARLDGRQRRRRGGLLSLVSESGRIDLLDSQRRRNIRGTQMDASSGRSAGRPALGRCQRRQHRRLLLVRVDRAVGTGPLRDNRMVDGRRARDHRERSWEPHRDQVRARNLCAGHQAPSWLSNRPLGRHSRRTRAQLGDGLRVRGRPLEPCRAGIQGIRQGDRDRTARCLRESPTFRDVVPPGRRDRAAAGRSGCRPRIHEGPPVQDRRQRQYSRDDHRHHHDLRPQSAQRATVLQPGDRGDNGIVRRRLVPKHSQRLRV